MSRRLRTLCLAVTPIALVASCVGLNPDVTPPRETTEGGAGDGASDSGPDATTDSGPDATSDSGPDATSEGGPDAMSEAGPNPEAASDSGPDAFDARPECWNLDFETGPPVELASVCQGGVQNLPAGMTPNGWTFLVLSGVGGKCSTRLSLFISDQAPQGSGVYKTVQVPTLAGADTTLEEGVTLMPDGLTLIAMNAAHNGFCTSTRSAIGLVDFSAPVAGDFAQITTSGSAGVWAPVISPDGLAFYYVVQGDANPDANPSVNGIYESVRTSTKMPFPPGHLLSPEVQTFAQYANGTSSDRLAIFLTSKPPAVGSAVFTREAGSDPFSNPLRPNAPPAAPQRARPLAGCTVLVGSYSLGGCASENVTTWQIR